MREGELMHERGERSMTEKIILPSERISSMHARERERGGEKILSPCESYGKTRREKAKREK